MNQHQHPPSGVPRIERRVSPPRPGYSLPPALQKWGLPAMVGSLLLALWAVIIVASMVQQHRLLEEGRKELSQLNSAVAQHTRGLLRDAETVMRVIDLWLQANPNADHSRDQRFLALMNELNRASGGVIELRLVRSNGMLFAPGQPLVDVNDREYFKVPMQGGERKLYIGEPLRSRFNGKWAIPLSIRLEKPVAGFAMVVGSLQLEKLGALHEHMRLKPNGTISMVRTDGIYLTRTPHDEKLMAVSVRDMPSFKNEYGVKDRGTFESEGTLTGTPRLASYERVADYPVVVTMTRPRADVLDVFNVRRNILLAATALITLATVAFTRLMVRSQRALRAAQEDLQRLEATDSLTGVMSRRAFLDLAQREFSRARRYERPTAVLIFDLDHFKRVNDTHGHAVGDMVLRECAAAWKAVLREQDLLGRIGGEEFCAVLPETPMASALHAAERLRAAVKRLNFAEQSLHVTVSVGMAMVSQGDDELGRTMERADRALYLAKERGRDRVETLEAPRLVVSAQPGAA